MSLLALAKQGCHDYSCRSCVILYIAMWMNFIYLIWKRVNGKRQRIRRTAETLVQSMEIKYAVSLSFLFSLLLTPLGGLGLCLKNMQWFLCVSWSISAYSAYRWVGVVQKQVGIWKSRFTQYRRAVEINYDLRPSVQSKNCSHSLMPGLIHLWIMSKKDNPYRNKTSIRQK